MGWSSGTEIFDTVANEIVDISYNWTGEPYHEAIVTPLLTKLYEQLSYKDWDTECESEYWDDPVIGKILGNSELGE